VWRALEPRPGRPDRVAVVKVLSNTVAPPGSWQRARFLAAADANRRVHHPHVVAMLESGDDGDVAYLAREYVEGVNLLRLISRSPPVFDSPALVAALGHRLADALHAGHSATAEDGAPLGLAHGELALSSVLVASDGTPKLTDFAALRLGERPAEPRRAGKLGYMAPEQLQGRPADHRADLFSLGLLLVELLAGRPLMWDGALALEDLADTVVAVSAERGDLPAPFTALLLRMTALAPAARPESAAEAARSLGSLGSLGRPRGRLIRLEEALAAAIERPSVLPPPRRTVAPAEAKTLDGETMDEKPLLDETENEPGAVLEQIAVEGDEPLTIQGEDETVNGR